MKVFVLEKGMFSSGVDSVQSSGFTDLCVKYIANKAAKNISSLASQTMVPTETKLGRSAWVLLGVKVAVVTRRIVAKAESENY
jgi:hypothetical protein